MLHVCIDLYILELDSASTGKRTVIYIKYCIEENN
jgi:hypothetical protein